MLINSQEKIKRRILYAQAVYGAAEKKAVLKSMENNWLASGPLVAKFEKKVARLFGKKYAVAVNSGSSANLLAIQSLHLLPGSEVITPACTFSTTASSIVLNNLVPVFVDTIIGRYTIDEDLVEKAITKKTRAIMVPQLIGGVCDMPKLAKIAKKYKLILIDDSCDALAPRIKGKTVASYSDITTTSFYGSHIVTTFGSGGMILTDSQKTRNVLITLRDWGRVGNDRENFEKRFNFTIDGIPYDGKFLYSELGHNCKMTESAAAFGMIQLERLKKSLAIRDYNYNSLRAYFKNYEHWFYIPQLTPTAKTNWLAFPLTIRKTAPFTRYDFLKHMEKNGIQTRVLFSGNIVRHPVYKKVKIIVSGALDKSDQVMESGFLLGCHQGINKQDVTYMIKSAEEFLKKWKI